MASLEHQVRDPRHEAEHRNPPLLNGHQPQMRRSRNSASPRRLIADSVIDIEASRSLIRWAAGVLDSRARGRHETSVAKVFVAEAVFRVIDRSLQRTGGNGDTDDPPQARLPNQVRPFRIYDVPSETHRWAIARNASRVGAAERDA